MQPNKQKHIYRPSLCTRSLTPQVQANLPLYNNQSDGMIIWIDKVNAIRVGPSRRLPLVAPWREAGKHDDQMGTQRRGEMSGCAAGRNGCGWGLRSGATRWVGVLLGRTWRFIGLGHVRLFLSHVRVCSVILSHVDWMRLKNLKILICLGFKPSHSHPIHIVLN